MTLAASDLAAGGGDLRDGSAVVLVAHLLAVFGAVAHAHVGRVRRRRPRQPAAAESLAATAGRDKVTIGCRETRKLPLDFIGVDIMLFSFKLKISS